MHKKQSGGAGQYGKLEGYIEPASETLGEGGFEFVNEMVGNSIPPEYLPAIEKGFKEAVTTGPLSGSPCMGVRVVLQARAHFRAFASPSCLATTAEPRQIGHIGRGHVMCLRTHACICQHFADAFVLRV